MIETLNPVKNELQRIFGSFQKQLTELIKEPEF